MTVREMICWWSRVAIVQEMQSNNKIRVPMLNYGRSTGDAGYNRLPQWRLSSLLLLLYPNSVLIPWSSSTSSSSSSNCRSRWDRQRLRSPLGNANLLGAGAIRSINVQWQAAEMKTGIPRSQSGWDGMRKASIVAGFWHWLSWRCIWILFLVDKNNSIYRSY